MDFIYTEDIARANILAMQSDVVQGFYNVATGVETSLLELAQTLLRVMEIDLPVEFGSPRSVNGVPRRVADTSAATRDLGFTARIGLEDGLRRLVTWWRAENEVLAR
jgi:UDP-glucose 4-epimerase